LGYDVAKVAGVFLRFGINIRLHSQAYNITTRQNIYGSIDGWMNGWITDGWMNGWMDLMIGWMDEWMNGWMDE